MSKPPVLIAPEAESLADDWKDFFKEHSLVSSPPEDHPFLYVTQNLFMNYHWERLLQTTPETHLLIYGDGSGAISLQETCPSLMRTIPDSLHRDGLTYGGISLVTRSPKQIQSLNLNGKRGVIAEKKWPRPKPALFLDRDGILVNDNHYVVEYEKHTLKKDFITPLAEALSQRLPRETMVFVVSNQSGIGRGFFSEEDVRKLHQKLHRDIQALGLTISDWDFSPCHKVSGRGEYKKDSFMRKPYPGMVLKICEHHPVNLERSQMIGDQVTDDLYLPQLKTLHLQGEKDLSSATSPVFACPNELVKSICLK